ncbi:MAG: hypothetical protein K2J90_14870 [Lachnospiraceae bacterium]|nr:hypothetical protein [Lachnospiraceae bacterium]
MDQKNYVMKLPIFFMFVLIMIFAARMQVAAAAPGSVRQVDDANTSVKIEWDKVDGATYYGIEAATDVDFANVIYEGYSVASITSKSVTNLTAGQIYYVRVGYGETKTDCYNNWSSVLEVVTRPDKVEKVEFTGADDTTVTLTWAALASGVDYYVTYNNQEYITKNNSIQIPYVKGVATATVTAGRTNASGSYTAKYKFATSVSGISSLTTKIAKNKFSIKEGTLSRAYINEAVNDFVISTDCIGHGIETNIYDVKTGKKKFSGNGTFKDVFQYNRMYKYCVRAYVNTTDGNKIYGEWSEYRYFINPKRISSYRMDVKKKSKIGVSWPKLTGVSKIKVQVSTKKNKGYKTCATLKGTKKSYTITKYGKSKLKRMRAQSYYVKVIYYAKVGNKLYASDIISTCDYKKWK